MSLIACSAFTELDDEIKQEFYEDVAAAIKDINECAVVLETGADSQVIERMFRSLHTVKGNCNMVFLEPFVNAAHKLEDLFSDIRSGDIEYSDIYGKFAVAVVNVFNSQLILLIDNQPVDDLFLVKIESLIDKIESTETEQRLSLTAKAIIAIQDGHYNPELVAVDEENGRAFSFPDATDLEFFEYIADKQTAIDPEYHQYVQICEALALKLNAMLKRSIEEQQVRAVVIFMGLSRRMVPCSEVIHFNIDQVFFASGLLSRMAGWTTAADVTLQLLESHDGNGMPYGLENEDIMPVAQAISLAFEFTSIVMANKKQGYKQALFTAVKSINAEKEIRYKSRLIERFNTLIKNEYLTGQMW